jgi:hypothetical protein
MVCLRNICINTLHKGDNIFTYNSSSSSSSNNNNNKYIGANTAASDKGAIKNNIRIAATLYCLGTWFVSGIYVYIPFIKGIVSLPIIAIIIIITTTYLTASGLLPGGGGYYTCTQI